MRPFRLAGRQTLGLLLTPALLTFAATAAGQAPPVDPYAGLDSGAPDWTVAERTEHQRIAREREEAARAALEERLRSLEAALQAEKSAHTTPPEATTTTPKPAPAADGIPSGLLAANGAKAYVAVRVEKAPVIDGKLNEPIWKKAPRDARFQNPKSDPHGIPSRQPTAVQVAYDAQYLYVAIRAWDPDPGEHDDRLPLDEASVSNLAESVSVLVDAYGDGENARELSISKSGYKADAMVGDNGRDTRYAWRGDWDAAVDAKPAYWTAEMRIPWSTVGLSSGEGVSSVRINFRRRVPSAGQTMSIWAIPPQSTLLAPPSYFGELQGLKDLDPGPKVYLRPYVTTGYRQAADESTFGRLPPSRLQDFTAGDDTFVLRAGLDGKVRPYGPIEVDFSVNPEFAQVEPDSAVANLDRFELAFPEVRPFFAEDEARLSFGAPGAELYYSRRIGLKKQGATRYEDVPILYALKARAEAEGTFVSAMNVGLAAPTPKVALDDVATVVRLNHYFGKSTRIGTIFLGREGDDNSHAATGVDGAIGLIDEHLILSGFVARTQTAGKDSAGAGQARIKWQSREVSADASYLEVGSSFDPQLGLFEMTGIRKGSFAVGYTPQIRNDYVGVLDLHASVDRARDRHERRVFDRGALEATGVLLNAATLKVGVRPATDGVTDGFKLGGGKLLIQPGEYDTLVTDFELRSPPREVWEGAVGYAEGGLWDGYQRRPWFELGWNGQKLAARARYEILLINAGGADLTAHELSMRALYAFSQALRTSLAVEAGTFDPVATVHLMGAYTFGRQSTVSLVLSQTADTVELLRDDPDRRALLSFAYGIAPF